MVGCIGEESRAGFTEERSPAAVLLGDDNLIEKENGGVVGRFRFALIDELVEACKELAMILTMAYQ